MNMFGYYRNFILNFAKLTRSLTKLKRTDGKTYKSKLIIKERRIPAWKENFDELKKCLTATPILAHPRFDRPYIL